MCPRHQSLSSHEAPLLLQQSTRGRSDTWELRLVSDQGPTVWAWKLLSVEGPFPVFDHSAVIQGGSLWVVGGQRHVYQPNTAVTCFDLVTCRWREAGTGTAITPCSAAITARMSSNEICIIGGYNTHARKEGEHIQPGARSDSWKIGVHQEVQVLTLPATGVFDENGGEGKRQHDASALYRIGRANCITGEAARQILRAVYQCAPRCSPASPVGQWKATVDAALAAGIRRFPASLRLLSDIKDLPSDASLGEIMESIVAFSVSLPASRRLPGTWVVDPHSASDELLLLDNDGREAKVLASSVRHSTPPVLSRPPARTRLPPPSLTYSGETEKRIRASKLNNIAEGITLDVVAALQEGSIIALSSHSSSTGPSDMPLDLPQATPPLLRGDSTGRSHTAYEGPSPVQVGNATQTENLGQVLQNPLFSGSMPLFPVYWAKGGGGKELAWKGVHSMDVSTLRTQMDVAVVALRHDWLLPSDNAWRKEFLLTVLHCLPQVLESRTSLLANVTDEEHVEEESKEIEGGHQGTKSIESFDFALLRHSWALAALGTCVRIIPELLKDVVEHEKELLPGLQGLLRIAAMPLPPRRRTLTEWQAVMQGMLLHKEIMDLDVAQSAPGMNKGSHV